MILLRSIGFAFISIIVLCLLGCEHTSDSGSHESILPKHSPDTSVFLTTFPTTLHLSLGKSVLIENVNTIIIFISVVQDSTQIVNNEVIGKAKVQLVVDYGYYYEVVELNINDIPGTYRWENGQNYDMQLMELTRIDTTYEISIKINQFRSL